MSILLWETLRDRAAANSPSLTLGLPAAIEIALAFTGGGYFDYDSSLSSSSSISNPLAADPLAALALNRL
jgi:hypothetical protein